MNTPSLPPGAVLLKQPDTAPPPQVSEEILLALCAPGITTQLNNGVPEVFLSFDVPTGSNTFKRYKVPFAVDGLLGFLDFVRSNFETWLAGLEAQAEALSATDAAAIEA